MHFDFARAYPQLTDFLAAQAATGNVSHAYLFLGSRGVGKLPLAAGFANALIAKEQEHAVLREALKLEFAKKQPDAPHPDIVFLRPKAEGTNIGIDAARQFKRTMHERPFLAARRIGVIVHAERLTHEAMASILKLLEEPPKNVVLILLGESEMHFPKTILSRCQVLRVPLLNETALREFLAPADVPEEELHTAIALARGRARFCVTLLQDPERRKQYETTLAQAVQILEQQPPERALRDAANDPQFLGVLLDALEVLVSDMLTGNLFGANAIRSAALKGAFVSLSRKLSHARLLRLARFLFRSRELLAANVSPQGIFDQLLVVV